MYKRAVFKWLSKVLNHVIAAIGVKNLGSTDEKQNHKQSDLVCTIFPELWATDGELLQVLIGSSRCLLLLWLVGVIINLVLLFNSYLKTALSES